MKIIAELISIFFNPALFFFLMPFSVVYRYTQDGSYAMKWFLFSAIFTTLGILLFLIGRLHGTFSDIDISKRKERGTMYVFAWAIAVFYLAVAILFKGVLFPLSIASIGIVVGLLVFEAVTVKAKASIHTGTTCAWVLSLGLLFGIKLFLWTVWVVPLVAWARLSLRRHTMREVIIGGLLGSSITLLTFYVGKQFVP
ncbi:MAG: phosphatase PAP2 family protein [Candidatus Levybacteria bacterium]|nr:phosphatase PAP2 family protein [Candidatus Levybacteria bacterium]